MIFRHEWKHQISYGDMLCLRCRLQSVMYQDKHAAEGRYFVRSLYFDDLLDTALRKKIDGVNVREKFRLRCYNGDTGLILLEKKSKINGLCQKQQIRITADEAKALSGGSFDCISAEPGAGSMAETRPLLAEFISKMRTNGLRGKTIVDYIREPFVYPAGNVRVTIDHDIRTGLMCTDFLDMGCATVPVPASPIILEVKWDEFLPDVIRDMVQLPGRRTSAFSKYAACRSYD